MFGKKENELSPLTKIAGTNISVTYLAQDCEIKGSFIVKGDARIDGKVEGTVMVAGDLVVGQTAFLKANIESQSISIAGEVHGNIQASEILELGPTSRLYGDINTRQLKIDQGARFIGTSTLDENLELDKSTPLD